MNCTVLLPVSCFGQTQQVLNDDSMGEWEDGK